MDQNTNETKFNDLYDRQIRTFGKDATSKLKNSTVYLYNLEGGLASEIAKNLVLSGVNELHLIDKNLINLTDSEFGFYYNQCNIDKNYRCDILSIYLQELNPTVKIETHKCNILGLNIKTDSTIVLCNINKDEVKNINTYVRSINCKTVYGISNGIAGFIFVDVNNHIVNDVDGENYDPLQITEISSSGKISCNNHYLQVNDKIKFTNLEGTHLEFLDGYWKVKNISKNSFNIVHYEFNIFPIRKFKFINGSCEYIKQPKTFNHKSFRDQLDNKDIEGFDHDFSNKIINTIMEIKSGVRNVDTEMSPLLKTHGLELAPVNSIIGGLMSTEVIKCISCKYSPISQWLTYHDFDFVPKSNNNFLKNSNNLFSLYYGSEIQQKINKLNILMVGCGALGCEWLKNLVMMGVSTEGIIEVTDPDHIERSNLSRQFLFRNSDIKKSKSKVAQEKINKLYPTTNIASYEQKVSNDNISFTNKLFESKDIIINALDNTEGRRFVDNLCFEKGLPLFESGTMGMKGNTQPVIPFITETYSNSSDPEQEKQFPVCTIKNFPNQIHHTIHWARDYFEYFKRAPENVNRYKQDNTFLDTLSDIDKNQAINDINDFLHFHKCIKWQDCCNWAINIYLKEFNHNIKQLLHCFPKDHIIDNKLFWSNGKRCPKPLNLKDSYDFINVTTRLLCNCHNIKHNFDHKDIKKYLDTFTNYNTKFVPKDVTIPKNDSEIKDQPVENIELLVNSNNIPTLYPQYFEKDDDTNYHIAWLTVASNCRAQNYSIPLTDEYTAKGIAGKIIPAVATTTSTIVGLICMELYKYVLNGKESNYLSYFLNMSNNTFVSAEPIKAPELKIGDLVFNSWEKLKYNTDSTLQEFINHYEDKFKTKITMILYNSIILYSFFMPSDLDKNIKFIIENKTNTILNSKINIIIACEDDFDIPNIELSIN